jgi:hypothetical protein
MSPRAKPKAGLSWRNDDADSISPYLGTDFPAWVAITPKDNAAHKISTSWKKIYISHPSTSQAPTPTT